MFLHLFVPLFCCVLALLTLHSRPAEGKGLKKNDGPCFIKTGINYWKLVMADEFEGEGKLDHWRAEEESGNCHGNWIGQVSCNRASNVQQRDGYLILSARQERFAKANFTAATLTSTRAFSHGRIEIRLSQPIGHQLRTSLFTTSSNESYWHDVGQIDFLSKNEDPLELHRGVHFGSSRDKYQGEGIKLWKSADIHSFHLYGVEWDSRELRFFFDDLVSPPVSFSRGDGRWISDWFRLKLQIGVGGQFFKETMPEDLELLEWKCPALIVDYIRVYEKIEDGEGLRKCEDEVPAKKKDDLEAICGDMLKGAGSSGQLRAGNVGVVFVGLVGMVLCRVFG